MRDLAVLGTFLLFAVILNVGAQPDGKGLSGLSIRPPRGCGPVCAIFCPNGNVLDARGCPTCNCKDEFKPPMLPPVKPPKRCGPVCLMFCPNGFVEDKKGCPICKCKPFKPPVLPPVFPPTKCGPICRMFCPNGFVKDKHGCPICKCNPSPVMPPKPCGPVCMIACPFGNVMDKRGCPTCRCQDGPFIKPRCPKGSVPTLRNRKCKSSLGPASGYKECGNMGFCHTEGLGAGICCRRFKLPLSRCPRVNPMIRCVRHHDQCKSSKDCGRSSRCCPGPCGRVCSPIRPRLILPKL